MAHYVGSLAIFPPCFRHRRIARPREHWPPCWLSRPDHRVEKGGLEVGGGPSIKVGLHAFNFDKSRNFKISSLRAPGSELARSLCGEIIGGFPCFRHRRIARPREGVAPRRLSRPDCWRRSKAASKSGAALRLKSDFTLLTLIKVGTLKFPR